MVRCISHLSSPNKGVAAVRGLANRLTIETRQTRKSPTHNRHKVLQGTDCTRKDS